MTQLEQNRYEVALAEYGLSSEQLMRLAEQVATAGLRRRGAVLGDRFDDLVSRLVIVGLNEAVTFEPAQVTRYGQHGGNPFVEWCADVMDRRIDDYFRSRAEGFSDRRYKNYGEVLPTEQVDAEASEQHAVEDAIERLDALASVRWYEQAAASEGLSLHHWIIRALNERAARCVPRPAQRGARRARTEPGPDHWPGVQVA